VKIVNIDLYIIEEKKYGYENFEKNTVKVKKYDNIQKIEILSKYETIQWT
jgi:hypothetical protein